MLQNFFTIVNLTHFSLVTNADQFALFFILQLVVKFDHLIMRLIRPSLVMNGGAERG